MSTSLQVTMTTAQGEALAREVIASFGMEEGRGECETKIERLPDMDFINGGVKQEYISRRSV